MGLVSARRHRLALSRVTIDAAVLRMQRNVYRDHLARIIGATATLNAAHAQGDLEAFHLAKDNLTALCLMAQDYDALQQAADTTPTVQEN